MAAYNAVGSFHLYYNHIVLISVLDSYIQYMAIFTCVLKLVKCSKSRKNICMLTSTP